MTEFEINGHSYRAEKMDAMTQFHVVCKFGPAMRRANELGATTILETFSALSDEDREYIVAKCMSVTKRRDEGTGLWAVVWSPQAKQPMFQDLNALHLMDISATVMDANFRDFFPAPPSSSSEDQEG